MRRLQRQDTLLTYCAFLKKQHFIANSRKSTFAEWQRLWGAHAPWTAFGLIAHLGLAFS
jgi:hypothetical protein